jgi:putative transposase
MNMKITEKGTRKFTENEKQSILKEAEEQGVKLILEKYDLYPATYYYWKKKYKEMGQEGLSHGMTKERLAEIRKLTKENEFLKKLLAEKELEGKLKDEMLKKKYPHLKKFL